MSRLQLPPAVLIGGDSLIGAAYRRQAEAQGLSLPWTSRRGDPGQQALALDLEHPGPLPWAQWRAQGCRHLLICAALTRVAACEHSPALSEQLNLVQPLALARQALEQGFRPVLFSSDYVFAGRPEPYREADAPTPVNVYGRHKAALEAGAAGLEGALLLRLSKVYTSSWGDGSLLAEMASALDAGKPLRVARDQGFSPIALPDVLAAIAGLIEADAQGLYQLVGDEAWTRAELARALARALDLPQTGLQEIELAELGEGFRRPTLTYLSNQKLHAAISWSPAPVQRAFAQLASQRPGP